MVPTAIQVEVKTHFNPAQCKGHHIRPSTEWLKAARKAINYVRHLETGIEGILRETERPSDE
jgi:hypothetical protein